MAGHGKLDQDERRGTRLPVRPRVAANGFRGDQPVQAALVGERRGIAARDEGPGVDEGLVSRDAEGVGLHRGIERDDAADGEPRVEAEARVPFPVARRARQHQGQGELAAGRAAGDEDAGQVRVICAGVIGQERSERGKLAHHVVDAERAGQWTGRERNHLEPGRVVEPVL